MTKLRKQGKKLRLPKWMVPESVMKSKEYGVYTVFITGESKKEVNVKLSQLKKYLSAWIKSFELGLVKTNER